MVPSKAVLISGASSGIGEAGARSLAEKGWTVFAGVRSTKDAHRLDRSHSLIHPVQLDVTSQKDIEHTISTISDAVGDRGLSGLVNASGLGYIAPAESIPLEDFKHIFDVNVFGLLALTQAALPLLRKGSQQGRVINVGSLAGLLTLPYASSYFATKHALEALTDALRLELRPLGVAVSLIRPGPIKTQIFKKSADYGTDLLAKQGSKMEESNKIGTQVMIKTALQSADEAVDTDQVVHVITKALTDPNPKAYYFDSWQTALTATMVSWIPTFLLDSHYDRMFHPLDN